MNANETTATHIRESISRLRYELQQYHDNASKGGSERRRNMVLLRWDIRKMERQLKAMETETLYRVTATASGIYSDFCDLHIAEKELNNLRNNGKAATLTAIAI